MTQHTERKLSARAADLKAAGVYPHGPVGGAHSHSQQPIGPENDAGLTGSHGDLSVASSDGKALKIVMYGAVNAMVAIPGIYGYAAIIFRFGSSRVADSQKTSRIAGLRQVLLYTDIDVTVSMSVVSVRWVGVRDNRHTCEQAGISLVAQLPDNDCSCMLTAYLAVAG